MALLPMGPPTTSTNYRTDSAGYGSGETQENMFDEPSAIAVPEEHETSYEAEYEAHAETAYEPAEEFSEDVPELISYQAGTGHAGIEPSHAPATEPVGEVIGEPAAASEPANSEQSNSEPAKLEAQSEAVIVAPAEETPVDPATEPAQPTMLTANDFAALEERVLRAVALVRSERQARIAAEERATALETQLHSLEAQIQQIEAQSPILERLVQEVESLRIEREQVRQRVERLLGQLDALEL